MDSLLFVSDYNIDPQDEGQLTLEISNFSFFKDNEWNGDVTPGYTLPGLWIQPKISYQALPQLTVEAGVHSLIYSGTTKYPNTIYQDIAEWKGTQYHSGTHLLPYFRAHVQLNKLHFILGNLYGGNNHRLPDPLYSSELNMTADPESGLQMLYDNKRLHLDLWANWESFIFKGDHHRESFVFGTNTQYSFTPRLKASLAILAHHRGGEIDTFTVNSVNTVMNASFGVSYSSPVNLSWLHSYELSANILGYAQESGKMWPIDKGWAFYAEGRMRFAWGLSAKVGYILNRNFISLLSYPYYGCLSLDERYKNATYNHPQMLNAQVDWSRSLGKNYALGVRAEMFQYIPNGPLKTTTNSFVAQKSSNSLSFGIFLRATPKFLLKKL